jgi:hypothetical protein
VRVDSHYALDDNGAATSSQPGEIPIQTTEQRGTSGNCYIKSPIVVPMTASATAKTPVGDYTTLIRWGKGGDGDVSQPGPPLIIHVVPPAVAPVVVQPPPPIIIVLSERKAALRPTLGKTVMLTHLAGRVLYKTPGGPVQSLSNQVVVPNGTVVDATKGYVKVTVERDASGALDSATAWHGSFTAVQTPPSGSSAAVTVLTLADSLIGSSNKGASAARAHAASTSKKKSLWLNGKGNFKTRGKRASAILRGTEWYTEDTGSQTTVKVTEGKVAVRDFVKKKTVLVTQGHSYTAKVKSTITRRVPAFTG